MIIKVNSLTIAIALIAGVSIQANADATMNILMMGAAAAHQRMLEESNKPQNDLRNYGYYGEINSNKTSTQPCCVEYDYNMSHSNDSNR